MFTEINALLESNILAILLVCTIGVIFLSYFFVRIIINGVSKTIRMEIQAINTSITTCDEKIQLQFKEHDRRINDAYTLADHAHNRVSDHVATLHTRESDYRPSNRSPGPQT